MEVQPLALTCMLTVNVSLNAEALESARLVEFQMMRMVCRAAGIHVIFMTRLFNGEDGQSRREKNVCFIIRFS